MRSAMNNRWPLLLALMPFMAACSDAGADDSAPRASVRDSAGVRIVENPDPAERTGWITMDAEPSVTIGVLEGAPEYQLYEVRGATRLSDGRIAVANAGSKEVRYYGADGAFLNATGRDGEGPGEFREMGMLERLPGDSVVVYDWRTRRLSLLDESGNYVAGHTIPPANSFPFPAGVLDGQSMLIRLSRMFGGPGEEPRAGLRQDSAQYAVVPWRGEAPDSVEPSLVLPGGPMFMATGGSDGNRWMSVMTVLLAPSPSVEVRDGRVYYGLGDSYEVRVYEPTGRLIGIVRRGHTVQTVTPDMHAQAVEQNLEGIEDENWRKRQREMIEDMPVPETLPAFREIETDEAGRLWVRRYTVGRDEPATWDVFDPEGQWLAAVPMPAGFTIHEIGRDYVLGVMRDELEVEQLHMYGLTLAEPVEG